MSTAPWLVMLLGGIAYALIYAGMKNDGLISVIVGKPTGVKGTADSVTLKQFQNALNPFSGIHL